MATKSSSILRFVISLFSSRVRMASQQTIDSTQALLLKEQCIEVDLNDQIVRSISKEEAHLLGSDQELPPLHRAFSVFLFNTNNELLLQQRSQFKITFPGHFTNSCCSHPLFNTEETEELNHLGIKKAARRRLKIELGIEEEDIDLSDIKVLTRIMYGAPSDSTWGEHEIDYILFIHKDLKVKPNPNEVDQVVYVSLSKFGEFLHHLQTNNIPLTPWFKLISSSHLIAWWNQLNSIDNIDFDPNIHSLE